MPALPVLPMASPIAAKWITANHITISEFTTACRTRAVHWIGTVTTATGAISSSRVRLRTTVCIPKQLPKQYTSHLLAQLPKQSLQPTPIPSELPEQLSEQPVESDSQHPTVHIISEPLQQRLTSQHFVVSQSSVLSQFTMIPQIDMNQCPYFLKSAHPTQQSFDATTARLDQGPTDSFHALTLLVSRADIG